MKTTKPPADGKGGGDAAGGKGKGKPKGYWVTVSYPNGGYHHIFVKGAPGEGAKAAVGKHRPKDDKDGARKVGERVAGPKSKAAREKAKAKAKAERAKKAKAERAKSATHPAEAAPHARHEPAPYEPGHPLTVQRDHWHDSEERRVAIMTGGKWNTGNEPADVTLPKRDGSGGKHQIEVKSKAYDSSNVLSVHAGALESKTAHAHAHPEDTWHTVATDARDRTEGGAHAGSYSDHGLYYKRAVGKYSLSQMHPVKNAAELKRLIAMPDHELPEKARGSFMTPGQLTDFRAKASKEREYNNQRKKDRIAKAAAEGRSIYRASKNYRPAGQPDSTATDSPE